MTPAQQADKNAAEQAFKNKFRDLVIADIRGLLSGPLLAKIRSEPYINDWNQLLSELVCLANDKETKSRINVLRMEAANLRKQYRSVKEADTIPLRDRVVNELGIELNSSVSLHEIGVILNIEMIKLLRLLVPNASQRI